MSSPYKFRGKALPENIRQSINDYIRYGRRPGSFLLNVLSNNFVSAVLSADESNLEKINVIAAYVLNFAPADSWGSEELVERWIDNRTESELELEI